MLFHSHHANLDRMALIWQGRAEKLNASMASTEVMWDYPASKEVYPYCQPTSGCLLPDVVSSNFPFTDLGWGVKPSGLTIFDVLDNIRPGKGGAQYTYDKMHYAT